ncbi:MAG: MotA/TolQ/ExbB proton channel family protein [Burkholderiaceae bacterium]
MDKSPLGLMHFWEAGDGVTHTVAWLLLAMSVASWYYILSKAWSAWRIRRGARAALERFWSARTLDEAVDALGRDDGERVFAPMAEQARRATRMQGEATLGASVDRGELVTRVLRQEMTQAASRLESGLTFLASVGSTAPFIGLFGTVWGIYHALLGIASSGQVMIDQVAGPVGEALVMTAAGLAVAIPAEPGGPRRPRRLRPRSAGAGDHRQPDRPRWRWRRVAGARAGERADAAGRSLRRPRWHSVVSIRAKGRCGRWPTSTPRRWST